jgi:putative ATPase
MSTETLFERAARSEPRGQPLAERMRPRTLEELVGQRHLLGPGRLLDRVLSRRERLPSMILWGPPGSGKTTMARLFAGAVGAHLEVVSAVQSGVKELRQAVAEAEQRLAGRGQRTLLFVDEIHRFNRAQQDALLPHVEAGTVSLVGATTENPSFEVNAALLSRAQVLRLDPLGTSDLRQLLDRALETPLRGLGGLGVVVPDELRELIASESEGDARRALTTLELAVELARPVEAGGPPTVDRRAIEEARQQKLLRYDRAGEEHYSIVSAFIKSMRGSDPDAAVYWMTRMLEAGEDPLFILRRLVIFASEDIGNADPEALRVAVAATEAVRFVGLPEGALAMTQAALYLACAPKSNSALTSYAAARRAVDETGTLPTPLHLRNASTRLQKELGYGHGYKYPHDFEGHYVVEEYLPEALRGRRLVALSDSGQERLQKARLAEFRRRGRGIDGE